MKEDYRGYILAGLVFGMLILAKYSSNSAEIPPKNVADSVEVCDSPATQKTTTLPTTAN